MMHGIWASWALDELTVSDGEIGSTSDIVTHEICFHVFKRSL
jgi:hypothetical protein